MLAFLDKDINIVIIIVFYMLKKLDERLNMVSRDKGDIKMTQMELLEMKTIVLEMENRLDRINDPLDAAEENILKSKT